MNQRTLGEISQLLKAWSDGESGVQERLWPLVYEQLREMAQRYLRRERQGHTLQPTELVHELYVRLSDNHRMQWKDRSHFFAMAARVMRRVLVDHARYKARAKRGGSDVTLQLDEADGVTIACGPELIAINDALDSLESVDPEKALVVELRFFGGLTQHEVADVLECSEKTVQRKWLVAKTWLFHELKENTA